MRDKKCVNPSCGEVYPESTDVCWKCGGNKFDFLDEAKEITIKESGSKGGKVKEENPPIIAKSEEPVVEKSGEPVVDESEAVKKKKKSSEED